MRHKNQQNFTDFEIAGKLPKELSLPQSRVYMPFSLLKLPETIQNTIHLGKFKKTYDYEVLRFLLIINYY